MRRSANRCRNNPGDTLRCFLVWSVLLHVYFNLLSLFFSTLHLPYFILYLFSPALSLYPNPS